MAVDVVLPDSLTRLFPGASRHTTVRGETVAEVVAGLDCIWPGIQDRLMGGDGRFRRHILVFVGEERADETTLTPAGCEVRIVPALSGG